MNYLLLLLMTLPNLVWAILNRGAWPSDACPYGIAALRISYARGYGGATWWRAMLNTDVNHPPLLSWIGQLFVPIGRLLGEIDAGLLIVPFIAQYLALVLVFEALRGLFGSRKLALLGCLVLASTPIFIGVGKQFVVQPIQLLVVAWFVYIVARAREWDKTSILLHLTAASALAMLTMLSTPSFCAVLGLTALVEALKGSKVGRLLHWSTVPMVLLCLLLVGPGLVWFDVNRTPAWAYARRAYGNPWDAFVEDAFLPKIGQWVDFTRDGFFFLRATLVLTIGICIWSLISYLRARDGRKTREARVAAVIVVQLVFSLGMLASASQQMYRYVLPLSAYLAVILVWCVFQLDTRWVTRVVAAVFLVQGILVHASDFGLVSMERKYASPVLRTDQERVFELMDGIVEETFDVPSGDYDFVSMARNYWGGGVTPDQQRDLETGRLVLVELRAFGVDGPHLIYHAWKKSEFAERAVFGNPPMLQTADAFVTRPGIDGVVDVAWTELVRRRPAYFVMPNAEIRRESVDSFTAPRNTSLLAEMDSLELANRVANSELFERVATPAYPELEIYEYRSSASRPAP